MRAPETRSKMARDLFSRCGAASNGVCGTALGWKTPRTDLATKDPDNRFHTNPRRLKDLALGWKWSSSASRVVRLDVRLNDDGENVEGTNAGPLSHPQMAPMISGAMNRLLLARLSW